MPDGGPLIPQWLAFAVGTFALLATAAHLLSLNSAADIDPRRRRIRMTNAVLIMLAIPFITYGFGIATPSRGRAYVLVWAVTSGLLLMIILVALVDMLHSWQLHRAQLRTVRRQIALSRGLEARAASVLASTRAPAPKRNPTMLVADPPLAPIPGLAGRALARVYAVAIARINRRFDRGKGVVRFDRPVISIGNLSVGGTGKTPLVRHITRFLLDSGHRPCIAMRGYKGGPENRSDEASTHEREFADTPIVAQANRINGLLQLFAREHQQEFDGQNGVHRPIDSVILDDGFQHRQIARDLDIVLIDSTRSPFTDRLLPAGWLREPITSLARANLIILTHAESASPADVTALDQAIAALRRGRGADAIVRHTWADLTILDGTTETTLPISHLRNRRIFAACAIGNPAPFLNAAVAAGGSPLAGSLILRDHDPFAPATIHRLIREATAAEANLILITDKDWSKLRAVAPHQWPCPIARPNLTLTFDRGEDALHHALLKTIAAGAPA